MTPDIGVGTPADEDQYDEPLPADDRYAGQAQPADQRMAEERREAQKDPRPIPTDWSLRDVGAWTKLVVCVGLGVALGAVNLAAVGAPGMLRIPAFLAALILCAQGPVDLSEYEREKEATIEAETLALREWEDRQEKREQERQLLARHVTAEADPARVPMHHRVIAHSSVEPAEATLEAENRVLREEEKKQRAQAAVRAGAVAESRGGLIFVAVLAIWLGLATLNYPQSPPLLLWLSLVASFLLFVSVWGGLQKRPTGA